MAAVSTSYGNQKYELLRGSDGIFRASSNVNFQNYDELNILFAINRGFAADNPRSNQVFHQVPQMDFPHRNYSFANKLSEQRLAQLKSLITSDQSLLVTGYVINRTDLVTAKICQLNFKSKVSLQATYEYSSEIFASLTLAYSDIVGLITAERMPGVGNDCACRFTCHVASCPTRNSVHSTEWQFYDKSNVVLALNRSSNDENLELNNKDCQDVFAKARVKPLNYLVKCQIDRVGGASGSHSIGEASTELWNVLRPCNQSEFKCAHNYQCIPVRYQCNGRRDCADGSDEEHCNPIGQCSGSSDEFQCGQGGGCIPMSKFCDGQIDCADGSDERNCTTVGTPCARSYFRCDNGRCARGSFVCDNDNDCRDRSDEMRCGSRFNNCPIGSYRCQDSSRCVPRAQVCDRNNDCNDGSVTKF